MEEQWAEVVVVRQEVVVFLEDVLEVAEEDAALQEGDFLEGGAVVDFEVEGVGSGVAQGIGEEEVSVGHRCKCTLRITIYRERSTPFQLNANL